MPDNETGDPRIADRFERNAATSFRDNASGPASEAPANNGRPNDLKIETHKWALENSTLGGRAKAAKKRDGAEEKQVESAENKSVGRARTRTKG